MAIRSRNKVEVGFSMSSMTDVVFLLLIFFMLTSTLVTTNAVNVSLPNSETRTPQVDNVAVSITEDLQYFVNKKPTSEEGLESALQQVMASRPEATIMLHADKTIPLDNAVKVLGIAYKNKYKIVLATAPK
ncbi:MAG: biopolymer transporter ExbD [Flavobacteriales bacterium]|nr:biopolymer transporter ExbD [Flavobacteriales bacterium]